MQRLLIHIYFLQKNNTIFNLNITLLYNIIVISKRYVKCIVKYLLKMFSRFPSNLMLTSIFLPKMDVFLSKHFDVF